MRYLLCLLPFLVGCSTFVKGVADSMSSSSNPIERGCALIAAAIIIHGIATLLS